MSSLPFLDPLPPSPTRLSQARPHLGCLPQCPPSLPFLDPLPPSPSPLPHPFQALSRGSFGHQSSLGRTSSARSIRPASPSVTSRCASLRACGGVRICVHGCGCACLPVLCGCVGVSGCKHACLLVIKARMRAGPVGKLLCGFAPWRLLACGLHHGAEPVGLHHGACWPVGLDHGAEPVGLHHGACWPVGLDHGACWPVGCTMAQSLWVAPWRLLACGVGPWRLLACGLHHGAEPVVCTMAPAGLWVTPWRPLAASHKPQGSDATVHHSHSASQPQCTAAMPHRSHALSLASGTVTPRQHYPQHAS